MSKVREISIVMQPSIELWSRHHQIDEKLLDECAYYPRGGCQNCSWEQPNPDCKRSHILIDTRIDGGPTYQPTQPTSHPHNKRKTLWGFNVEDLLKRFPKGIQENILKIMAE